MTDDLTARRQRTVTAPDLRDEAKAALTSVVEGMTGRPVRSGAVTVHRVDGAPFVDATVTLRLWPGEAARIRAYGAGRPLEDDLRATLDAVNRDAAVRQRLGIGLHDACPACGRVVMLHRPGEVEGCNR